MSRLIGLRLLRLLLRLTSSSLAMEKRGTTGRISRVFSIGMRMMRRALMGGWRMMKMSWIIGQGPTSRRCEHEVRWTWQRTYVGCLLCLLHPNPNPHFKPVQRHPLRRRRQYTQRLARQLPCRPSRARIRLPGLSLRHNMYRRIRYSLMETTTTTTINPSTPTTGAGRCTRRNTALLVALVLIRAQRMQRRCLGPVLSIGIRASDSVERWWIAWRCSMRMRSWVQRRALAGSSMPLRNLVHSRRLLLWSSLLRSDSLQAVLSRHRPQVGFLRELCAPRRRGRRLRCLPGPEYRKR